MTPDRVEHLTERQLRLMVARVDERNEQIRKDKAGAEAASHGR